MSSTARKTAVPDAWLGLLRVFHQVAARIDESLIKRHDLCLTWFEVMVELESAGSPVRVSDLAARVTISQPRVSRVVRLMADRGLVTRTSAPDDARGTEVGLTAAGEVACKQARTTYEEILDEAFRGGLSTAEVGVLRGIVAKFSAADAAQH
jgi:DNA-binding MarR family transcriptional regulator